AKRGSHTEIPPGCVHELLVTGLRPPAGTVRHLECDRRGIGYGTERNAVIEHFDPVALCNLSMLQSRHLQVNLLHLLSANLNCKVAGVTK
ncbi:MAG: hypothetical protein MJY75_08020, partial [Bacteroidaceae bacterium]|nr:hypothetical protein [Bacteroidaceae bacterium]